MKTIFTAFGALIATATATLANGDGCEIFANCEVTAVPEITALEGTAAIAALAAIVLLTWERRRRAH